MYQYEVVETDNNSFEQKRIINAYARSGWEFIFAVQDNAGYDFFLYFRKIDETNTLLYFPDDL